MLCNKHHVRSVAAAPESVASLRNVGGLPTVQRESALGRKQKSREPANLFEKRWDALP